MAAAKALFVSSPTLLLQSLNSSRTWPHPPINAFRPIVSSKANPSNGVFIRGRKFHTAPVTRERRNKVLTVSRLVDDNSGNDDESAHRISDTGAAIDIKLPRRSLLVEFTCNQCSERTKRIINRLAYERGLVFVQIWQDGDMLDKLFSCISRLVHSFEKQDKILDELVLYREAEQLFGHPMAIRQRNKRSPVEWWGSFGASTPNLQKFAKKILGLTCSACRYEHNWSIFEELHSKKRNRLAQNRLNDIVFIKYNRALGRKHNFQDNNDRVSIEEINRSNEWLVERMDGEFEDNDDSLP